MILVFARTPPAFTAAGRGRGGARRVRTGSGRVCRSWGGQGGGRPSAAKRARRPGCRQGHRWVSRDQL